ncbi:hypothetical protein EYF80_008970 [Liparis tanakae]|uniref:Uncharacterized protein n=1 Tax=Liparis tanakae TaxID=230148 RepID=A0A4Z2ISB1_9TELE|nr:hypothetical protein EYF80_008970 [Liparis tanakae]
MKPYATVENSGKRTCEEKEGHPRVLLRYCKCFSSRLNMQVTLPPGSVCDKNSLFVKLRRHQKEGQAAGGRLLCMPGDSRSISRPLCLMVQRNSNRGKEEERGEEEIEEKEEEEEEEEGCWTR